MKNERRIMWITAAILTLVSAVVLYLTHRNVPFMMDDLWYSTLLYDETPIASLGDIVKSQVWHFHHWGGRSMTHGILQLTLLAGEQAADVLNVAVTFLLAGTVCLVAGQRRLPAFLAAFGMLLGLNANWKMSMFWQAGAANYLYITTFLLFFVFCYLREIGDAGLRVEGISDTRGKFGGTEAGVARDDAALLPQVASGCSAGSQVCPAASDCCRERYRLTTPNHGPAPLPGITLWILPLGILAGWSNENMGPTVWILSVLVILLTAREGRKVPLWMILGSLSSLFGSVMVVAAPGNFVRSSQVAEKEYGLLWRFFLRCYAESKAALEYLFPTLLVLAAVLLLGRFALKIPIGRRNRILLLLALLSWGAMILSPHYPDRASFGTMALLICVILSMSGKVLRQRADLAWPLWAASVVLWLRGMYFCGEFLAMCWGWIR